MFVDEQIGLSLPSQPKHPLVEVLDPPAHDLPSAKLHMDGNLALAERTQIKSLLSGLTRRRSLGMAA